MPQIRIRGHLFEIPREWRAGHTLSPGEAQAMTQLFTENIRNNVDQWVVGEVDKAAGGQLSAGVHQELQRRIEEYVGRYEFRERPTVPPRASPLERHVQLVAEEKVRQERGLGPEEPVPAGYLGPWLNDREVREEAKKRLEIEQRVARVALEMLL